MRRDAVSWVFTVAAETSGVQGKRASGQTVESGRKMFELYGVDKDGMVYRSPPPRRKEVDILEVGTRMCVITNLSLIKIGLKSFLLIAL